MIETVIAGMKLTMPDARQIINMGGPHIGDAFLGTELMAKDCIVGNFVYQEKTGFLFFVKYHRINYYQGFTINFYDIKNKLEYEFDREFSIVHLGNFISENKLEIYPAFHGEFKNTVQIFDLDEEDFSQIS